MEDRSLDEFFESDEESPEAKEETAAEDQQIEPAEVTARWDSDSPPCDRCGEATARLWQDGAESVCRECKEW